VGGNVCASLKKRMSSADDRRSLGELGEDLASWR
jgi:hypothetical protein